MSRKYSKRADGRYEAKVVVTRDADGKAIAKHLFAKSPRELEKKVQALKQMLSEGACSIDGNMPFFDYAQHWVDTYKTKKEQATRDMYVRALNHCDSIFVKPLSLVTSADIQKIINDNWKHRRTCEQILLTVKQIYKVAINDRTVTYNPVVNISMPKPTKSKRRALTDTEKQSLKTADFTLSERAYIFILYGCGLRRGEALALTISDINFDDCTISVTKSLAFDTTGNRSYIKDCKTENSERVVPMPDTLAVMLRGYIDTLSSDKLFTKADGKSYISPSSYRRFWGNIVKKMNAPKLTAHYFRHNYATELYYSGISIKKAANLMGHVDVKMIMQIYAHLDEIKENTTDKINQIMNF